MNSSDVLGYAYEAALHCERCTRKRFPQADSEFSDVADSEGNNVHPLFASDETSSTGEYCYDCGAELAEPYEEDSEPTDEEDTDEPQEEDIITHDHQRFYYCGKLIVEVDEGEEWQPAIGEWCKKHSYFPDVWWISDHGNAVRISVSDDGRYLGGAADDQP